MNRLISFLLFILVLSSCTSVFYQPEKQQFYGPEKMGLSYYDVSFLSKDNQTKLHGWVFPAVVEKGERYKGLITHFHGNAQNISSHFISLAWIVQHGYTLFIFDYRGYGQSEEGPSGPTPRGLHLDALAALEYGHNLFKKEDMIYESKSGVVKKSAPLLGKPTLSKEESIFVVYGQSLGGVVAMRALADYPELEGVNLVVMDSTFSSYQSLAFDKLASTWLTFLISPLAYLLISDEMESKSFLPKFDRPLLVIHGDADHIVPKKFGEEIFNLAMTGMEKTEKTEKHGEKRDLFTLTSQQQLQKWQWIIPGGAHINAMYGHENSSYYQKQFLDLLKDISRK
ncbi:MAG: alpha/beta hydrolase [Oligoflexia bacterium]|nr:alpha/beta hydrolase [Oligoflexia bacterium]